MGLGISQKFEAIKRSFDGPVFVIDATGEYRDVTTSDTQDLLYAAPETLEGQTFHDLFPAQTADRFHSTVQSVLDTDSPATIEYELSVPAGDRWFEATIAPIPPTDESPEVVLWMARDITDRKEYEHAVTALHETALTLHTSTSQAAICQETIQAAESILDFDQSIVALVDDNHLQTQATSQELPADRAQTIPVDDGIAGTTYRSGESWLIDDLHEVPESKAPRRYRSCLSVPIGDHGNFQAVDEQPAAFDESDQELAELLVAQADAALTRLEYEQELERHNERLEEFANIVSHDLQTPLTVAQGRVALAQQECETDHLADVADAHERMEALIEDLLALAKGREAPIERSAVHLEAFSRRQWERIDTAEATLVTEASDQIRADSSQLRHVFENLFTNALDHGGEDVTVTVGATADGFYVADDGPGIPPAEREQVFQPGYSTADDGTGFGLRIVKQVVDAHGWEIQVGEGADGGARFDITGVEFSGE